MLMAFSGDLFLCLGYQKTISMELYTSEASICNMNDLEGSATFRASACTMATT